MKSMWKDYTVGDLKKNLELTWETRKLSLAKAKFEVYYLKENLVSIRVRCREGSPIYKKCKEFGYKWGTRGSIMAKYSEE